MAEIIAGAILKVISKPLFSAIRKDRLRPRAAERTSSKRLPALPWAEPPRAT